MWPKHYYLHLEGTLKLREIQQPAPGWSSLYIQVHLTLKLPKIPVCQTFYRDTPPLHLPPSQGWAESKGEDDGEIVGPGMLKPSE